MMDGAQKLKELANNTNTIRGGHAARLSVQEQESRGESIWPSNSPV